MTLPFRRSTRPTRRAWEVEALLWPLSPVVRDTLRPWLLAPTDPRRWPPPDTFEPRRLPISPDEANDQARPTACKLLHDELRAIRQTLDMPLETLSGLTRNGLLTVHGIRLRQVEQWLWPFYTAREITRLIAR